MPQQPSLRVPRATSVVALLCLALLLPLVGCSSLGGGRVDPEDKVAVAKRITSNLKEGDRLVASQEELLRSDDIDRRLSALPTLKKAEALFTEARDLSRESASPRYKLGEIRSLIGVLYMGDRDRWRAQIDAATASGASPSPEWVSRRDRADQEARSWLDSSNREFEFYHRFLSRQHPNPRVYTTLSMNYELLGNYSAAEQSIRILLESFPRMSPEERAYYEKRARGLRERRLDSMQG